MAKAVQGLLDALRGFAERLHGGFRERPAALVGHATARVPDLLVALTDEVGPELRPLAAVVGDWGRVFVSVALSLFVFTCILYNY